MGSDTLDNCALERPARKDGLKKAKMQRQSRS